MSDTTSPLSQDTPPSRWSARFLTFFFALIAFTALALMTIFLKQRAGSTDAYENSRAEKRIQVRNRIDTQAKELLTSSAWVDQGKGVVRIPLDVAIQLEIADVKQKTPRAAYAVGSAGPIPANATPDATLPSPTPAPAAAPASAPAPATQPAELKK
jgi:hypothetical protein